MSAGGHGCRRCGRRRRWSSGGGGGWERGRRREGRDGCRDGARCPVVEQRGECDQHEGGGGDRGGAAEHEGEPAGRPRPARRHCRGLGCLLEANPAALEAQPHHLTAANQGGAGRCERRELVALADVVFDDFAESLVHRRRRPARVGRTVGSSGRLGRRYGARPPACDARAPLAPDLLPEQHALAFVLPRGPDLRPVLLCGLAKEALHP